MKSILLIALTLCIGLPAAAQTYGVGNEAEQQNTPEGWQAVALPRLPRITDANTFNITAYGATTESADNSDAIQKACNAVPYTGGMVYIPAGTWMCGKIRLKSKTILHLAAGATLKLLAYSDYQAKYNNDGHNFIEGNSGASDLVVEGEDKNTSIIDGQGDPWWALRENDRTTWNTLKRGTLIRFSSGSRYLVKNLTFRNAPGVNLTMGQSGRGSDATIHDIIIRNPSSTPITGLPSHNTDGISMWCPRINIYNCDISTGDDNVVVDANGRFVHVWNCLFGDGHGASIGSYTSNVHDVIYEGITFNGTGSGFKIKSSRGRSGNVYNIIWRNSNMTNVGSPISIDCWYGDKNTTPQSAQRQDSVANTPAYHDILIQRVVAKGTPYKKSSRENYPIFIFGLPESYIRNVVFDDVYIEAGKGMSMSFCRGITFRNGCHIVNTADASKYFENNDFAYDISPQYTYDGSEPSGISEVSSSETEDNRAVYTIDGRKVAIAMSARDMEQLPKGIYIVGGKKIVNL